MRMARLAASPSTWDGRDSGCASGPVMPWAISFERCLELGAVPTVHAENGVNNCHFTDLDQKRNIWWFDLPLGRIAVGQYEWIHLLMHNAETDQLLHLKVPTAFLREHIEGLVVRNAGKRKPEITLELGLKK